MIATMDYLDFIQAFAVRNREIVRLHKRGVSQSDIARRYNLSRQRIHKIIKEWGRVRKKD